MKTLLGRAITAAYQNPGMRPHLVPLILKHMRQASMDRISLRRGQFLKLMNMGGSFGILSAYGPGSKSENKERHSELVRELQKMGYRKWETLRGKWEGVSEKSLLVPKMRPMDLFYLGRVFRQAAVIYKSPEGVLGMYYTTGPQKAQVAINAKDDPAFEFAMNSPELYSKARGMSFEFGFLWGEDLPWDGRTPLTRQDVIRHFEKQLAVA